MSMEHVCGLLLTGIGKIRIFAVSLYLLVCGLQDLRNRRISIRASVAAGIVAAVLDLTAWIFLRDPLLPYIGGLLPGILLLLLSAVSDGAVGVGDGICFLVIGAFTGMWPVWGLLMASLISASVCGVILMALHKAGRRTRLPLLAFTAIAWLCLTAIRLAGPEL